MTAEAFRSIVVRSAAVRSSRPDLDGPGSTEREPGIVGPMNLKLKPVLIALGSLAALLIVTQLVMGLLIVRGGGSINLEKLVKVKPPSHHLLRICAPVRTIGSWGQL